MSLPPIFLAVVLLCPFLLSGQATPPAPDHRYPDQAYLSPSRYSNPYFGFTFELPPEAQLRPVPRAVASDGRLQLLAMGGPPPADAEISIVAFPEQPKFGTDAKSMLRHDLNQELFIGVEELRSLSKTSLGGHQFYLFETRRGVERHMLLAADFDGYVVQVMLAGHDEKVLQHLESSFQHLQFLPPSQLAHLDPSAQPYDGPAISTHQLATLQADPPAEHIAAGEVQGGVYKNGPLGFSYRIPAGWTVESEGAVEPALQRAAQKDDLGGFLGDSKHNSTVERQLMQLCSRTLFSAWAERPGLDDQISYDDFGEVTISAVSAGCFPGVSFPTTSSDREGFKNFLKQFALAHPVMRDMRDAKAFTTSGSIVLYLHGTVAIQVPNDELSRRLSVAIAITERRGYLLSWFFAAPHDSELQQLLAERVRFDLAPSSEGPTVAKRADKSTVTGANSQLSEAASAASAQPATNAPTADPPTPVASTSSFPPSPGTAAAPANSTQQQPKSNPGTTADSGQQDRTSSTRPTLLRPGETMQDQQVKGKPIPKPNH